jgi:hypothetical protein
MPVSWFIGPYKQFDRSAGQPPIRYLIVHDLLSMIRDDGGDWKEAEVLGNYALFKVRASLGTLRSINDLPGVLRIPNHVDLTDTLGDLTAAQRQSILSKLNDLGYTTASIVNALGSNWANITLGQLLRHISGRWVPPRWDRATDSVKWDSTERHSPGDVDNIDVSVRS